jgi:hypothetical protein
MIMDTEEISKKKVRRRLRFDNILKVVLVLVILYIAFFRYQSLVEMFAGVNEESSENIALAFVLNSPTYRFDGTGIKLINTKVLDCRNCWEFTYEFKTTHSGYGDRSGQSLDSILEGHKMVVAVSNREISSAVIDDYWDDIRQKVMAEN